MLENDAFIPIDSARTQRLSEGVCWFFLAATILLALLDAYGRAQTPLPTLSVAWIGVFALYYALRTASQRFHGRLPLWSARSGLLGGFWRPGQIPLLLLLDLLVITCLFALSGGWASPLYLVYMGWAVSLLDAPSTLISLCLSGIACSAFVLGVLLAPHEPFSALQVTLVAEHALLLLFVGLGISGIGIFRKHTKWAWEAEHRQWDALRQTVFSQLSHELYTPLSALSASAALLAAAEEPMAADQHHLLSVIERNCARMNLLITDLLALWREPQRQSTAAPKPLCALAVAQSVGDMLGPLLAGKRQRLTLAAEPADVCVLADSQRLEQVLVNLLVNAHKYAPAETTILLTISRREDEVLFAVQDEGTGVPLEEQGYLFDWLYRGADSLASSRGSGIGLALAKALVELQGGRIWLESIPDTGSTFYFLLPAAEAG